MLTASHKYPSWSFESKLVIQPKHHCNVGHQNVDCTSKHLHRIPFEFPLGIFVCGLDFHLNEKCHWSLFLGIPFSFSIGDFFTALNQLSQAGDATWPLTQWESDHSLSATLLVAKCANHFCKVIGSVNCEGALVLDHCQSLRWFWWFERWRTMKFSLVEKVSVNVSACLWSGSHPWDFKGSILNPEYCATAG